MSDVEKYGLFALVFVVVVLGLAWVLDPAESDAALSGAGGPGARAVPMSRPAADAPLVGGRRVSTLSRPGAGPGGGTSAAKGAADAPVGTPVQAPIEGRTVHTYRVAPLAEGLGAFDPSEPPVSYPGEHARSQPVAAGTARTHTVVAGDTLSDISFQYFGTSTRWSDILALNKGIDPKALKVGTVLVIHEGRVEPGALQPRPTRTAQAVHTVAEGETLGHIAQKTKGSVEFTDAIFQANRDVLATPDAIKPGMVLRIP